MLFPAARGPVATKHWAAVSLGPMRVLWRNSISWLAGMDPISKFPRGHRNNHLMLKNFLPTFPSWKKDTHWVSGVCVPLTVFLFFFFGISQNRTGPDEGDNSLCLGSKLKCYAQSMAKVLIAKKGPRFWATLNQ